MTSICPKCNATIDQDHAAIPSDGLTTKCPSCNARVQLVRESFVKMAYYQSGKKSCAACGNQLGHTLHCSSCNTIYPDFFIAADPTVIRRQARERRRQGMFASFQGIEFSLPDFKSRKESTQTSAYTPQRVVNKDASAASKPRSTRLPILIIIFIIIIAITGGGYTAYARHKTEKTYIAGYFKALYGIKTGAELTRKQSTMIATEWKTTQDYGRVYSPRITSDEEARLNKVRSEVDKLVNQLKPPAEKFEKSRETLVALNNQYAQMHSLAITAPSSLAALSDGITKSGVQFDKISQELKASLDGEMVSELNKAKQTYKVLKDF